MIEVKKIGEVTNLFGDDIAYAERWDFSKANMSHESRVNAITQIASVCYANPNAVNRESLYNRLAAESLGLPSSSFEFVPVYLDNVTYDKYLLDNAPMDVLPDTMKYAVVVAGGEGLITNYRALLNDVENGYFKNVVLDHYNTLEECKIMEDYCFVYKTKIDMATARQFMRHRVNLQELSRRYVSGKKLAFEFYVDEEVEMAVSPDALSNYLKTGLALYDTACANGCKAEQARRLIPVGMYTILWSGWDPSQFQNMLALRTDGHAQREIQLLAGAMKELKHG